MAPESRSFTLTVAASSACAARARARLRDTSSNAVKWSFMCFSGEGRESGTRVAMKRDGEVYRVGAEGDIGAAEATQFFVTVSSRFKTALQTIVHAACSVGFKSAADFDSPTESSRRAASGSDSKLASWRS